LPYEITHCYLPSSSSERQPSRFTHIPDGWKAELTWVVFCALYSDGSPVCKQSPIQVVTGPDVEQPY